MPEIFADQHTHAPETGIECPDLISPGEETAFIEQAIGGQVHFVVDMQYFTL